MRLLQACLRLGGTRNPEALQPYNPQSLPARSTLKYIVLWQLESRPGYPSVSSGLLCLNFTRVKGCRLESSYPSRLKPRLHFTRMCPALEDQQEPGAKCRVRAWFKSADLCMSTALLHGLATRSIYLSRAIELTHKVQKSCSLKLCFDAKARRAGPFVAGGHSGGLSALSLALHCATPNPRKREFVTVDGAAHLHRPRLGHSPAAWQREPQSSVWRI